MDSRTVGVNRPKQENWGLHLDGRQARSNSVTSASLVIREKSVQLIKSSDGKIQGLVEIESAFALRTGLLS